jgi:hypothetical protein
VLQDIQRRKYGKTKAIAAHVPTRFASIFLIIVDLLDTEEALRELVERDDWAELAASSENAKGRAFCNMQQSDWWKQLRAVQRLFQPVSDAIHQLEGDQALLSQVVTVWHTLIEHAKSWVDKRGDPEGTAKVSAAFTSGVIATFTKRREQQYRPCWTAAYLLDPINFKDVVGSTHPRPPLGALTQAERSDVVSTVARITGSTTEEVEEELDDLDMGVWDDGTAAAAKRLIKRVELKQRGNIIIKVADTAKRINFWQAKAAQFPIFGKAAVRLISMHASTAAAERNWSAWGRTYTSLRNRLSLEAAQKMVYVKANINPSTAGHSTEVALDHMADE